MSKLKVWLKSIDCDGELETVSADASFRKYYRLKSSMHSSIIMDASAQKESLEPYINIGHRLYEAGVRVPKVNTYSKEEGFIFMEDMGAKHLANIEDDDFELFYTKAIDTIVKMQNTNTDGLATYNADFLHFEMDLMQEWYIKKHLGLNLDEKQEQSISSALEYIVSEVLSQPQGVFVHRDYHSRNIMISPCDEEIVLIDFHDARVGAVTYDLVSLLRDVYVELEPQVLEKLALSFRDNKGLDVDDATFMRWFDFMGLQRHIKILGIFARLALRDGKEEYLKDIPLTLKYVLEVASKYPEMKDFLLLFSLKEKL